MLLPFPLVPGRLLRRYKRFLADIRLDGGEELTAHCANPGAMLGLAEPGMRVWLSRSSSRTRKLPFSLELVEADDGRGPTLVGINTGHPNRLAEEAILAGTIPELDGYPSLRREVRYGTRSRVDLVLGEGSGRPCYVEIKNVHLVRRPGRAEFPDCVTARGARHLAELAGVAAAGARAVMLFVIQRGDIEALSLARDLDPAYGAAFDLARAAGVEALAYACDVSTEAISVARPVPLAD